MLINKKSSCGGGGGGDEDDDDNNNNNSEFNLIFPGQLSVEMLMYSNIQNTSLFNPNPVLYGCPTPGRLSHL